jgi:hypothetical protein
MPCAATPCAAEATQAPTGHGHDPPVDNPAYAAQQLSPRADQFRSPAD